MATTTRTRFPRTWQRRSIWAGVVLSVIAATTAARPTFASSVAIVDGSFYTSNLKTDLEGAGHTVTEMSSYTAASLAPFDAVIHYGNTFTDFSALELYVQGGGTLVETPWLWWNESPTSPLEVVTNGGSAPIHSMLYPGANVLAPGDPLLAGVTFPPSGGFDIGRTTGNGFTPGSTAVATWGDDSTAFIGYRSYGLGRVIAINLQVITSDTAYTVIDQPWATQLLSNAVGPPPCGNGLPDPGEACDDGNVSNGDCCDSTCQYESSGSPCDDATVCNGSETCDGAGVCQPGLPLDCDDSNACTSDSCDPESGCGHTNTPNGGCLTAGKSILLIKNAGDDTKDKLLWKWLKGDATTQPALADPTVDAAYALCIYAGPGNAPIASAVLPPSASWSEIGTKGYKFKGTSPNGLSLALLKGGAAGKSKALAKGNGAALPDPMLPLAYPVTVQLKKDGSPLCLESTFTSLDEKKNVATQFKAKH